MLIDHARHDDDAERWSLGIEPLHDFALDEAVHVLTRHRLAFIRLALARPGFVHPAHVIVEIARCQIQPHVGIETQRRRMTQAHQRRGRQAPLQMRAHLVMKTGLLCRRHIVELQ